MNGGEAGAGGAARRWALRGRGGPARAGAARSRVRGRAGSGQGAAAAALPWDESGTPRGLDISGALFMCLPAANHGAQTPGTPTRVLVGPASLLYLFFFFFFHDQLCFLSANGKLSQCTD